MELVMNYFEALKANYLERYSKVPQDDEYYYLYKHLSFGPFNSDYEFAVLDTFNKSTLLFSKPTSFNDPYDCLSIVNYDFSKITRADLEKILKKRITCQEFKLRKHIYIRDLENQESVKNWGDLRRDNFRLTCFNGSPLNILMWAHYACNHQGFMVEFKFKKRIFDFSSLPIPVLYDNKFPIMNFPYNADTTMCIENANFGSETLIKFFANKAECWSYENEFRLLETGNNNTEKQAKEPLEVDSDLFVNVILGTKTTERHALEIQRAVDNFNAKYNNNLKIYKAQMMSDKYEIFVPNHPRLDK